MKNLTRGWALPSLLGLGLLALPPMSTAHLPALYGKEFIRSEPAPGNKAPVRPPVSPPLPSEDEAGSYDWQVQEQEQLGGPYCKEALKFDPPKKGKWSIPVLDSTAVIACFDDVAMMCHPI